MSLGLQSLSKTYKSAAGEDLGTQMQDAAERGPLTQGCLPTRLHAEDLKLERYT